MQAAPESSDETQRVYESIVTQEIIVARADMELAFFRRLVERSLARKERLLTTLALTRALVAPIRRLPVELISMIFIECIEDPEGARHRTLALVCRWWKAILWDTAFAWSRITFALHDLQRSKLIAATSIALARKSRLAIEINAGRRASVTEESLAEILSMIGDSSLRSIVVDVGQEVSLSNLSAFYQALLESSKIQHLEIIKLKHWDEFPPEDARHAREALDNLTSTTVLDVPHNFISTSASFLGRLTSLSVSIGHRTHLSYDISTLRGCVRLRELSLTDVRRDIASIPEPFTLPELRSLRFSNSSFRSVFVYLRAPLLQDLTFQNIQFCSTEELSSALKQLVVQPKEPPSLVMLKLFGVKFNQQGLISALECLPTLVELEITNTAKINYAFVSALTREATTRRAWMMPRLKRLTFHDCWKLTRVMMEEVIEKREKTFEELKSLGRSNKISMEFPGPLESVILRGDQIVVSAAE